MVCCRNKEIEPEELYQVHSVLFRRANRKDNLANIAYYVNGLQRLTLQASYSDGMYTIQTGVNILAAGNNYQEVRNPAGSVESGGQVFVPFVGILQFNDADRFLLCRSGFTTPFRAFMLKAPL